MECFVDLGIVDQFAIGLDKVLFRNGIVAHDLRLLAQVEAAHDLAMAYDLTSAAAVGAEGGFSSLAGGADALAVAAGAIHFAIDAIRARDGLSFGSRVCMCRVGDRHTLLADALEGIWVFFVDGGGDVVSPHLERW